MKGSAITLYLFFRDLGWLYLWGYDLKCSKDGILGFIGSYASSRMIVLEVRDFL